MGWAAALDSYDAPAVRQIVRDAAASTTASHPSSPVRQERAVPNAQARQLRHR